MTFKFDSVVFHTKKLSEIREFYEGKLGFPTGVYEKNGQTLPDYSLNYVNSHVGGGLIGFEQEESSSSLGDLVIRVSELDAYKEKIRQAGVRIVKETPAFFIVHDPEGRTLIFEPNR